MLRRRVRNRVSAARELIAPRQLGQEVTSVELYSSIYKARCITWPVFFTCVECCTQAKPKLSFLFDVFFCQRDAKFELSGTEEARVRTSRVLSTHCIFGLAQSVHTTDRDQFCFTSVAKFSNLFHRPPPPSRLVSLLCPKVLLWHPRQHVQQSPSGRE